MAIIAQDSFTRADQTGLGNADTGQSWQTITGAFKIIGNQASVTADSGNQFAVIETGQSDQIRVSAILNQTSSVAYAVRLTFRVVDVNNLWFIDCSGTTWRLMKRVAGSYTQVSTATQNMPFNLPTKVSIELNGSEIKWYFNDALTKTITDSALQTATKHGIGAEKTYGRIDDFIVETLTSSGTAHTKSLSDSVNTSESFSKQLSAMVIDSVATGDGTNESSAKSFSDSVLSADSLAYTQGKAVSLSDSIAITEAISKALTKWQMDGISTGDSESEATSKKLSDAIMQTDVITAFGGKSVILTEGITVSDSVAKAVGRLRSDGLGLADSLGKQLSVRLYDVVISTDAVSTYLPNAPEYRHVMRFPVRLNTRQTVHVTITQRKQFDVDI